MTDVKQLRLVLTVPDFNASLSFYRDALGLGVEAVWSSEGGHVVLLSAGRATLELVDEAHAAEIDRIEVGRRVAGPVRVAFEVDDSETLGTRLAEAGAKVVGGPVTTPWNDRNVRLEAPDGTQLTLFTGVE
jgi:catechol 2,3-dioxygenase-like lactoylglutathione lyase family enzyme